MWLQLALCAPSRQIVWSMPHLPFRSGTKQELRRMAYDVEEDLKIPLGNALLIMQDRLETPALTERPAQRAQSVCAAMAAEWE